MIVFYLGRFPAFEIQTCAVPSCRKNIHDRAAVICRGELLTIGLCLDHIDGAHRTLSNPKNRQRLLLTHPGVDDDRMLEDGP